MKRRCRWILVSTITIAASLPVAGQIEKLRPVTDERLVHAEEEPENWFVFRRTWNQWGYSPLEQIDQGNVRNLRLAWSVGMNPGRNQQEPAVIDGIMFLIHPQSEVEALDARTGKSIWRFRDS